MRTRVQNPEVLYADETLIQVTRGDVQALKGLAAQNERRRVRLCTHASPDDPVHEMLIVHTPETYVRPHKHLNRVESFHVIEGEGEVLIFDDAGEMTEVIALGDYLSGRPFYYRLSRPSYHSLLISSPVLVFQEVTSGPFRPADTQFAPWSPENADRAGQLIYMQSLRERVRSAARGRPS